MYYHTRTPDTSTDGVLFRNVMIKALEIAKNCGTNQMGIACDTQQALLQNYVLKEIIGEKKLRSLSKHPIDINNIEVHFITKRKKGYSFVRGPVVIVYMQPDFVDDLMQTKQVTDVIYIPWNERDLGLYQLKYSSLPY